MTTPTQTVLERVKDWLNGQPRPSIRHKLDLLEQTVREEADDSGDILRHRSGRFHGQHG